MECGLEIKDCRTMHIVLFYPIEVFSQVLEEVGDMSEGFPMDDRSRFENARLLSVVGEITSLSRKFYIG